MSPLFLKDCLSLERVDRNYYINKFARAGGGNWNTDATWSTTSGGAADTVKPTASDDVFLDASSGAVTVDNTSVCKTLTCTGYTNTLTHNAFTLTVSGSAAFVSGMTYTLSSPNGPLLAFNASGTLTTAGKIMPKLQISGSSTLTLGDNCDFGASPLVTFTIFPSSILVLNGKTIGGNSSINRLQFLSGTVGTGAQITVGTGTFKNADFQDIIFSKATNIDLSAITGLSGDCGGNTITGGGTVLTFTTSAPQTWSGTSGGNWSANAWTSRVPLPQDDVVIASAFSGSPTITTDMPRLGRSIDFTGSTNTFTFNPTNCDVFGSVTFISGMTLTGSGAFNLKGRSSYTITSAGKQLGAQWIFIAPNGTYTLNDAISTSANFNISNGTFNSNGFAVTGNTFISTSAGTRGITMGLSIWTATSTAATTVWNLASASLTFSGASGTFKITSLSANTRTFAGAGLTYGTLNYTPAGSTGELDITGANTFSTINFSDSSNARSLKFTAGTTTTVGTFNVNGTSGKLMTVTSITGAAFTMTSSNQQSCDYLNLTNSVVDASPKWYAGVNSTDNGGNTNWIFTAVPPNTVYISLVSAESDWYITRSSKPANSPLNEHKRAYWRSKGITENNKGVNEAEKAWLRSVASSSSNNLAELWRQAVSAQGLSASNSLNANKFKFYTSVTTNP